MELSQSGEVIQAAVLNVTNVVKAESQPGDKWREEAEIRAAFIHQCKPIEDNTSNDSWRCFCMNRHRY